MITNDVSYYRNRSIAILFLGGAALIVAIVTGSLAVDAHRKLSSDWQTLKQNHTFDKTLAEAEAFTGVAVGCTVVAIVCLGVGSYLWKKKAESEGAQRGESEERIKQIGKEQTDRTAEVAHHYKWKVGSGALFAVSLIAVIILGSLALQTYLRLANNWNDLNNNHQVDDVMNLARQLTGAAVGCLVLALFFMAIAAYHHAKQAEFEAEMQGQKQVTTATDATL